MEKYTIDCLDDLDALRGAETDVATLCMHGIVNRKQVRIASAHKNKQEVTNSTNSPIYKLA